MGMVLTRLASSIAPAWESQDLWRPAAKTRTRASPRTMSGARPWPTTWPRSPSRRSRLGRSELPARLMMRLLQFGCPATRRRVPSLAPRAVFPAREARVPDYAEESLEETCTVRNTRQKKEVSKATLADPRLTLVQN